MLIISANGNSKTHNQLHPKEFFTIGGYNDEGRANYDNYKPHPASVYGQNGDGDIRPDLLAPFSYLPVPFCESEHYSLTRIFSYFGGSCGAATVVTGAVANLLSTYPKLSPLDIRAYLANSCYQLKLEAFIEVPLIHVEHAIRSLKQQGNNPVSSQDAPITQNRERLLAISITNKIDKQSISRPELLSLLSHDSEMLKKVIISYGLKTPQSPYERETYWNRFETSPKGSGERISWLYQLLFSSTKGELHRWISLLLEPEIEITLCVKLYVEKHYPEAPSLYYSSDPNPNFWKIATQPLIDWAQALTANRKSSF
nr:S8 family serine peptidase [Alkalihalobacillus pseudalcaliphilus]